MKINIGVLTVFTAGAALLMLTMGLPAQNATPVATPKPAGVKADNGSDLFGQIGDQLAQSKIYFRRGSNCDAKKDYVCAIENYSRSIAADPMFTKAVYLRAIAEMNLHRDVDAIADFNRVIQIDTKNDAAYTNLGIIYDTTGQYDKAFENYRLAIKAAPQPAQYEWLAQRIDANFKKFADKGEPIPAAIDLNEALIALNTVIKLAPDEPVSFTAYKERAIVYRNLARAGKPVNGSADADVAKGNELLATLTRQATTKMEEVVAAKEKDLAFKQSLQPYFKAHDYATVIRLTTDAISQNPAKFSPYHLRAEANLELHKYPEAIADATKSIELFPEFSNGYEIRGEAKRKNWNYTGALIDLDRAIELDPQNVDALRNRAAIYLLTGEYDLADIDLLRTLDLVPGDPGAKGDMDLIASLRASGYNTGKVKDDALQIYIQENDLIRISNDTVLSKFAAYTKAAEEQPHDNVKVCRLLTDTDVSLMVMETFGDKIKELVSGGRLEKMQKFKQAALATIGNITASRTTINSEYAATGCKK